MPPLRILLVTGLAVLALPASALGQVVVNPGDDPNAKVDSANPGETVLFKAGAHTGVVSVEDADITLAGEPGAFLVGPADAADPTIAFSGAGGTVRDLTVLGISADGVRFAGGDNQLLRSTVATLKAESGVAAAITGGVAGARSLTVDSSVLVGPTALRGATTAALDTTAVAARHVTAIGNLVANGPVAAPAFTVTDSIVRGTRTGVTVDPARNSVADTPADAAQLFVRPAGFNYHLRADAPVIDKGQMTSGESATDVDGEPRVAGSASDYGADEFVNRAPTALLDGPAGAVREGRAVTFDASKSTDPERNSGGGIVAYRWEFGDGTRAETTTPTIAHAFAERKQYSVTVTVTDKQGRSSAASSPVAVSVLDGKPPTVTIGQPGVKQRLNLYKRNKPRRRARVTFFGNAADDTALATVYLALRAVASKNGVCRWFDGKSKLVARPCAQPTLLTATLTNGAWRYRLGLKARLPRGPYQLLAVAVDSSGLGGQPQAVAFRFR